MSDRFGALTENERRLLAETLRENAQGDAEMLALADEAEPQSEWERGYADALREANRRNEAGPTTQYLMPWLMDAMRDPDSAARHAAEEEGRR